MTELEYKFWRYSQAKMTDCPHNKLISCDDPTRCSRCGWNPDVARERAIRIREELRGQEEQNLSFMLGSGTFEKWH